MWRLMVRDHAESLSQDTEVLLAQLQPMLGVAEIPQEARVSVPRNLTDVRRAVGELKDLVEENDRAIQQLFSPVSRSGAGTLEIEQLAHGLRRTARIADVIAGHWSLEP
jgi:hypothetical protein